MLIAQNRRAALKADEQRKRSEGPCAVANEILGMLRVAAKFDKVGGKVAGWAKTIVESQAETVASSSSGFESFVWTDESSVAGAGGVSSRKLEFDQRMAAIRYVLERITVLMPGEEDELLQDLHEEYRDVSGRDYGTISERTAHRALDKLDMSEEEKLAVEEALLAEIQALAVAEPARRNV
jgi:hypothetical protein